jgi:RNA polymerase subunit RPABC4/transcription elongation factor Spt4
MEAIIARGIQIIIALGAAYLVALWFVLIVWTYRDIESRSKNVLTQVFSTLLSVLFFIPGVLLYMVLRPRETLDSTFQRSLEEEYLMQDLEELPLCPTCEQYVHDDFKVCPNCRTQLRDACPACERLVDLRWNICPYCGEAQHRAVPLPKVERPDERWVAASTVTEDAAPAIAETSATPAVPVAPAAAPVVFAPAAQATPVVETPIIEESEETDTPAVLTVFHHGQQVATIRPFDRRRTKANGRRAAAPNRDNLARQQDEDTDLGDETTNEMKTR